MYCLSLGKGAYATWEDPAIIILFGIEGDPTVIIFYSVKVCTRRIIPCIIYEDPTVHREVIIHYIQEESAMIIFLSGIKRSQKDDPL